MFEILSYRQSNKLVYHYCIYTDWQTTKPLGQRNTLFTTFSKNRSQRKFLWCFIHASVPTQWSESGQTFTCMVRCATEKNFETRWCYAFRKLLAQLPNCQSSSPTKEITYYLGICPSFFFLGRSQSLYLYYHEILPSRRVSNSFWSEKLSLVSLVSNTVFCSNKSYLRRPSHARIQEIHRELSSNISVKTFFISVTVYLYF